ncbi:MAG: beta-galactosidase [Verrucomicrobiota bacterium]
MLMYYPFGLLAAALLVIPSAMIQAAAPEVMPERTVVSWSAWPATNLLTKGAEAMPDKDGWLVVQTRKESGRVGVSIPMPPDARDLEAFAEVAVPVRNLGSENLRLTLRVDDEATESLPTVQHRKGIFEALISPGPEPVWLVVPLGDKHTNRLAGRFISMVGQPRDFIRRGSVNGANVTRLSIFTPDPTSAHRFAVGLVIARGTPAPFRDWPEARVFPFIDEFGQFAPRDWPGKIHTETDFAECRQRETADLAVHARPVDWDRYGGWAGGPQLSATGFFRAEKYQGAWWMVDPEGRLFWSHGVVRVGTRVRVGGIYHGTPLPDREPFFRLPAKDSPLGVFYGTQPQSTRGYYLGRDNHAVYDFLEANLCRKYGTNWSQEYAVQAQRRLASWGLNTIANSSDPLIYTQRKTPYTAIVYSAPLGRDEFRLQGSGGNWGKLPDPFDPGWRQLMDRTLSTELKASLDDPWCLGFFVDNELHWGDTCYLAEAALASPAGQFAKQALVAGLQKKYADLPALNAAWGTAFPTWDAILAATSLPDKKRPPVRQDLEAFSEQYLDAYFRGCRDAIKAAAPNHLYLGCRFAGSGNAMVMRVAAQYCDIVSINSYSTSVTDLRLPAGLDRPILIGEFHFDAMDAPMHPAGLVLVANHTDRARAYMTYVRSALQNPAVIGTHWFQFYDQPTTGRFDGENYQTGLVDVGDTPYWETIAACREMGNRLYQTRVQKFTRP